MTAEPAGLQRWLPARLRRPSRWWLLPPLTLGALVLLVSMLLAPGTPRDQAEDGPLPVHVITVEPTTVVPRYVGHGRVRPRQSWQAVAQVPGAVHWRHPELQPGARFDAGERLLTIDRDDYEAAAAQAESRVRSAEAALEELAARAADLERSLEIERRALNIAEADFARNVELAEQGHISQVRLGQEEQALLRQRQTVQNLTAQIHLLPAQRQAAEARLAETRAALSRAERDLGRTEIVMPFDGRIDSVTVEQDQFVPLGQPMLRAESTADMEVVVEAAYELLLARFPSIMTQARLPAVGDRLPAEIRDGSRSWPGRVVRIDPGLARENRAAQVYVAVEVRDDASPPAANLYLDVEIEGPPLADRLVIPRLAWRQGEVLVATADDTLERRPVEIEFAQEEVMVIRRGLEPGERVIVTDVLYPADGMPVAPRSADPAAP